MIKHHLFFIKKTLITIEKQAKTMIKQHNVSYHKPILKHVKPEEKQYICFFHFFYILSIIIVHNIFITNNIMDEINNKNNSINL